MSRSKSQVESALLKKGFRKDERDHHYFIYYTQDGKKTTAKTKTSHSPKMRDISDNLLRLMAGQCKLNKKQFLSLIDCPLKQEKYEEILKEQGLI